MLVEGRVGLVWLFDVVLISGPLLARVSLSRRILPVMTTILNNWLRLVSIMFPREVCVD